MCNEHQHSTRCWGYCREQNRHRLCLHGPNSGGRGVADPNRRATQVYEKPKEWSEGSAASALRTRMSSGGRRMLTENRVKVGRRDTDPLCPSWTDRTSEALPIRGAAPETCLRPLNGILGGRGTGPSLVKAGTDSRPLIRRPHQLDKKKSSQKKKKNLCSSKKTKDGKTQVENSI